jgi:hypothetical protein
VVYFELGISSPKLQKNSKCRYNGIVRGPGQHEL